MKTYILIMVLTYNQNISTITQEFMSKESCYDAIGIISKDVRRNGGNVMSANCFEK